VAPSLSIPIINQRLDLVELIAKEDVLRERLVTLLKKTFDAPRLVQKFTFGRGDADDLMELANTIKITSDIDKTLVAFLRPEGKDATEMYEDTKLRESLSLLRDRFVLEEPKKLAERISSSIDEEGVSEYHKLENREAEELTGLAQNVLSEEASEQELMPPPKRLRSRNSHQRIVSSGINGTSLEPFIMKKAASANLRRFHERLLAFEKQKEDMEIHLQKKFDAPSLTLRWTPSLGHICHVKGKDTKKMASVPNARPLRSSQSTGSFSFPEWSHLGADLDKTRLDIRIEEQRVLSELRTQVVKQIVRLRRNASVLDELDVACGFAALAKEQGWVRPILNSGTGHHVVGGRHPVVEGGLGSQGRSFTPNDCFVGCGNQLNGGEKIWLVTGPNMAGKSTFLRQNALLVILAQTGSFVPASYAELGLVDKVFSRVGSADNLYNDQSTFMVEMVETAEILRSATDRSFVIMDEVGRGTTPEDGVAVGFACMEHLHRVNKCRTIFATHFHILADMTSGWGNVACYCNDIIEDGQGGFSYVHKLKHGINRESHALKVARIAGNYAWVFRFGCGKKLTTVIHRAAGGGYMDCSHRHQAIERRFRSFAISYTREAAYCWKSWRLRAIQFLHCFAYYTNVMCTI
jgi:DNA mismatch repair ATPase MutS